MFFGEILVDKPLQNEVRTEVNEEREGGLENSLVARLNLIIHCGLLGWGGRGRVGWGLGVGWGGFRGRASLYSPGQPGLHSEILCLRKERKKLINVQISVHIFVNNIAVPHPQLCVHLAGTLLSYTLSP